MLDSARVHQETGFCRAPPFGGLPDRLFRDPRNLRGARRRPLPCARSELFKTSRVVANKLMIEPVVFNHQRQNSIEESGIATRFYGKKEVAGARDGCDPWVDDNHPRAALTRLPHIVGGDGCAL